MSPAVYEACEEICRAEPITGPVLEVGAVPGPESLLELSALAGIGGKTGLNLQAFPPTAEIRMAVGHANRMTMFPDASFGCVLCNATLGEHRFPGDSYRFTEQAVREVFLEGLVGPRCRWVMSPPRIIGWARKP